MMNSKQTLFSLLMCVLAIAGCDTQKQAIVGYELALTRAKQTLDSLYLNYSVSGTCLLRENYPSNIGEYTATYLASEAKHRLRDSPGIEVFFQTYQYFIVEYRFVLFISCCGE